MKKHSKKKISTKKYFITLCIVFSVLLFGSAIMNVVVDPFYNYRMKSVEAQQDSVFEQKYSPTWRVGMSRHMEGYDSIWVGSSLSSHIDINYTNAKLGINCATGIISSGRPNIYKEFIQNAINKNDIKTVYYEICVDHIEWEPIGTEYDMSMVADYIKTDSVTDDAPYIFNRTVAIQSLMEIKNKITRKLNENKQATQEEGTDSAENAIIPEDTIYSIKGMAPRIYSNKVYGVDDNAVAQYIKTGIKNVQTYIEPLLKENPDIRFVFVVPPTGITKFAMCRDSGILDSYIESNKAILSELLKFPNAEVYDYISDLQYNLDLNNYMDDGHFEPAGMNRVIDELKDSYYRVTTENMDITFDAIKKATEEFKWPFMKENFSGKNVKIFKKRLVALGYELTMSATYDPTTVAAVKKFQKDNGLEETGIAYEDTMNLVKAQYKTVRDSAQQPEE